MKFYDAFFRDKRAPRNDRQPRWWFIWEWYDCWVGVFYDRDRRRIYILPIPMIGIVIQLRQVIWTFCPYCNGDKTFRCVVDNFGVSSGEFGPNHWYQGHGRCKNCKIKSDVGDSTY